MSFSSPRPRLFGQLASLVLAFLLGWSFASLESGTGHTLSFRSAHKALRPQPTTTSTNSSDSLGKEPDWSRFAYTQYATDTDYLCNSVMFFERLHVLKSKADRLLLYPKVYDDPEATRDSLGRELDMGVIRRLLTRARDEYGVKMMPVEPETHWVESVLEDVTWVQSFTKLLVYNQTQYSRVLNIDSDTTLLQHMDELFLSPPSPVGMTRAYWLSPNKPLTSLLVLATPSSQEFARIQASISSAKFGEYDMEILNGLYADNALVLPHRPYTILSGEFRKDMSDKGSHIPYMGNEYESFDPAKIYNEAKLVHFSDWPIRKPWYQQAPQAVRENQPRCIPVPGGQGEDCRARDIWLHLYSDFVKRRANVCGLGVVWISDSA